VAQGTRRLMRKGISASGITSGDTNWGDKDSPWSPSISDLHNLRERKSGVGKVVSGGRKDDAREETGDYLKIATGGQQKRQWNKSISSSRRWERGEVKDLGGRGK